MTAQTHSLHTVPHLTTERPILVRVIGDNGPRWRTRAERKADHRHRRLVQLEALLAETPRWCLIQRWLISQAAHSCRPSMWS